MVPPPQALNLDITAISGICGSISIACWIVVFSPQIISNFQRHSGTGLSLQFVIAWLVGDVFNVLGAVLQGVLPTMLILAIYYTFADMVLLGQCFYYRGFTWRDEVDVPVKKQNGYLGEADERTGLLTANTFERRESGRRENAISATHLSPVVPLIDAPNPNETSISTTTKPTTQLQATMFNLVAILIVCSAGWLGWYISERSSLISSDFHKSPQKISTTDTHFSLWGQIFGYLSAALYLGSRIPQLLLNYRRKSTEGVSILFFLFACIGNLTYVLSIFAYEAKCSSKHGRCREGEKWLLYWTYIGVNASWLAGSLGTFILDLGIFAQFFIYRERDENEFEDESICSERDERPLLDRGDSTF